MAIPVIERHNNQVSWTASGAINLELSPKPYTITRLVVIARPSITTTSATWFNDALDRIITNLSLSGNGKTYFDYRNMRVAYWQSRFALKHLLGYGRPTVVADSQTTLVNQFAYIFHFGVQPRDQFGDDNPFDLSAGIPPSGTGNLTLQGTFSAAATIAGTNVTIADCDLDVYCYGVRPESGDPASAYMPAALPLWTMETPTPAATSSAFATSHNIPAGNYLHDMLVMLTNGTNAPRDDSVLNSIRLQYALEARDIVSYGGQSGAVLDYKAAEILSQLDVAGPAYSDNVTTAMTAVLTGGTPAVPAITAMGINSGLVWFPMAKFLRFGRGNLYGADLSHVNTGDLKLQYGVSDATGVTMDVAYRKYQML